MQHEMTDADWLRQAFLLPKGAINRQDRVRRQYSEASMKFTDTTLGGNMVINPLPQYTRYADLKQQRPFSDSYSKGMGRAYSDYFDDRYDTVHIRWGQAEYNSLSTFFTSFYDADLAQLGRTGRTGGLLFGIGKVIGFTASLALGLPIVALIGRIYRFMLNKPAHKYYYLKPAMPLYWNTVNTMLNELAVNLGLIPPLVQSSYDQTSRAEFSNAQMSQSELKMMNRLLPDIFRGDGGVDIYAVATRAQRLSSRWDALVAEQMEKAQGRGDARERFIEIMQENLHQEPKNKSIYDYVKHYMSTAPAQLNAEVTAGTPESTAPATPVDVVGEPEKIKSYYPEDEGTYKRVAEFLDAEMHDGSQFVTFRVDNLGTVSESFSNSARESDIQSTINSMSSQASAARFSIANGNIGDGAFATMTEGFIGGVKDVLSGIASGVGISGLATLAGNAFVDVPKHYDGSTAQLPTASFTLHLRSWAGNDVSRFMNLYVPLCLILAGALPLSAGNAAYQAPFLCEAYSRGRFQIRTGMIDAVQVMRGMGTVGFNKDKKPLGIDVQVSIIDLSSIIHVPIVAGANPMDLLSVGPSFTAKLFAEDTAYRDYMAVLSSMSLSSQIYQSIKFMRNLNKAVVDFNSWFSVSHMANWVGGTTPGRIWSAFVKGTDRL